MYYNNLCNSLAKISSFLDVTQLANRSLSKAQRVRCSILKIGNNVKSILWKWFMIFYLFFFFFKLSTAIAQTFTKLLKLKLYCSREQIVLHCTQFSSSLNRCVFSHGQLSSRLCRIFSVPKAHCNNRILYVIAK